MAIAEQPTAILSHLYRADGSATFTQNGYGIIASVNGPIEVQRKDELPAEATVHVIVRPAAGVGGMECFHNVLMVADVPQVPENAILSRYWRIHFDRSF